jgi:hypothetical protein
MKHEESGPWEEEPKEIWGLWIRGVFLLGGLAAVAVKLLLEAFGASATWPAWCSFGLVVVISIVVCIRRAIK